MRTYPRLHERLLGPVSLTGLTGALLFAWVSLTPSLLPRQPLYQGAALALAAVFGYSIGVLIGWLVRSARYPRRRRSRVPRLTVVGTSFVAFAGLSLLFWPDWQNEQRDLVQVDHVGAGDVLYFLVVGLALTLVLIMIGRLMWHMLSKLDRWLVKRMPRPIAYGIGLIVFGAAIYLLTVDVVWGGFTSWANNTYSTTDGEIDPGQVQPASPLRSGSPDSLALWETLGVQGRAFVSAQGRAEDIEAFTGVPAMEPIRVYAGLASVGDVDDRAQLVLSEMERTGAWEREVVIIWSTTGTGWVDPDAARAVEIMFGGDTAIAAMQYSYLPSWISFMVDQEKAADAGSALFEAMVAEWESLPQDDRPELLLFGESLGSFGAEAAVGGVDLDHSSAEAERTDGVVFLGPTDSNVLWQQLIERRNHDSPAWRPHADRHPEVLVGNLPGELEPMQVDLSLGRIVYYHHPSDPVGYWNWETLWRPQRWADEPVGYDVSPNIDWYPWVSFWHVVFDLIAGFSAPSGYGHNYAIDMPDVWAAVSAPEGWAEADTERLRAYIDVSVRDDSSS